MREKQAAMRLERAIGSVLSDASERPGERDEDLLGRVRVAQSLAALDLVGESRVRKSLRRRLEQVMEERRVTTLDEPRPPVLHLLPCW